MHGAAEKVERTIRSIFGQSYPFVELVLIYCEEDRRFVQMAKEFRSARSHIPVRAVPTLFAIDSQNDRVRALDTFPDGSVAKIRAVEWLTEDDSLDGADVLPGSNLPVRDLFRS